MNPLSTISILKFTAGHAYLDLANSPLPVGTPLEHIEPLAYQCQPISQTQAHNSRIKMRSKLTVFSKEVIHDHYETIIQWAMRWEEAETITNAKHDIGAAWIQIRTRSSKLGDADW